MPSLGKTAVVATLRGDREIRVRNLARLTRALGRLAPRDGYLDIYTSSREMSERVFRALRGSHCFEVGTTEVVASRSRLFRGAGRGVTTTEAISGLFFRTSVFRYALYAFLGLTLAQLFQEAQSRVTTTS